MSTSTTRRCSMPVIAAGPREALAELTSVACDEAVSTDAVLACFDAAEEIVANALKRPVVI
jgi:hypothetical protein